MITLDHIQKSPEWYAARCGVPTASNFDCIVTSKGEPSKQRTKYLYRLAGERITGVTEEMYQSAAMKRGSEMEAEARSLYQIIKDEIVTEVGFCLSDGNFKYGASPDALVGEKGSLEIKCPIISTHVGYLLENKMPTDYFQQTQGQLLVTGREFVDFISYYPAMKPLIVRVERDQHFLKLLKSELEAFCQELEVIVNKIR